MQNENCTAITAAVDALLAGNKRIITVGIDGDCTSGKTTLAALLGEKYGAEVYHADDYFLPSEKRTAERLSEPGGNMERERLLEEVLIPLSENRAPVTRRFDCTDMALMGPETHALTRLNIVEGSYCLHPDLRDYYDLKIALRIDGEEQLRRVLAREGEAKLEAFREKWIPMEKRYFETFDVFGSADIVIKTN